jgi:hypothetical protein
MRGMNMKKIQTVVAMKIKGRLLEFTAFIDDIEDTTKSVNFKIDRGLYKKFEHIVGRGNVSGVIKKFISTVVRKYEKLSDFNFLGGYKHERKQREKEKG